MAQTQHTPAPGPLEGALTVLFCLVDDAYACLTPRHRGYESLKKLSDSEVLTLALFQQLRGMQGELEGNGSGFPHEKLHFHRALPRGDL